MSEDLIIVQNLIYEIRGQKVMLDFDLAKLYQVSTGALNQAVKRNIERFPPDFMFLLTGEEVQNMMSQFVISSKRKTSAPPFAFTEQGVAMLASVLKSPIAVATSISIGELSSRMEEKKREPQRRIGFQQNIDKD